MLVTAGVPLAPSAPVPPPEPTFALTREKPTAPTVLIFGASVHFQIGDSLEVARHLIAAMRAAGEVVYTEKTFYHYNPAFGVFVPRLDSDIARLVHSFTGATQGWKPTPEEEAKAKASMERWRMQAEAAEASGQDAPPEPKIRRPRLLALNAPFVSAVMTSMINELEDAEFFEAARPGIVFANGFVEVRPEAIYTLPHSAEHRARHCFAFDYTPEAQSGRFAQFCREIWQDEEPHEIALRHQLYLSFIGVCNLGLATRFAKAIVQYGEGSNGKTTLMEIVNGCMPSQDSITNVTPHRLEGEYYRDMLAGKLLNSVEELPETYIEDTGPLKAAITGDYMLGRAIRKAPRRFKPIAGHLYNANNLPRSSDHSAGFWRRLIVVDFKRDFEHGANAQASGTKRDMAKYVLEETPAILCEALAAAWHALRAEAYPEPAATRELMEKWREDNDTIVEFISTCLVPVDITAPRELWIKSQDLYHVYTSWANQNGHARTAYASNKFRTRLQQLKYRRIRRSDGWVYPFQLKSALGTSGLH